METCARISDHRTTRRRMTSIAVAIGLPLSFVLWTSSQAQASSVFPDQNLAPGYYKIWAMDGSQRRSLGLSGTDQLTFATSNTPVVWHVAPNKDGVTQISAVSGGTGCI